MPLYHYRARDKQGTTSDGEVEAINPSAVAAELRRQGLWATSIATSSGPQPAAWQAGILHTARPPSPGHLGQFLAQLASLLRSGINAHDAMSDLAERTGDRRLQRAAGEIADGLAQGASLSAETARYPNLFPPHVVGAVAAGEQFGALPQTLEDLATQAATEAMLQGRLKWLRIYYGVTLILAVLVTPFPMMIVRGMSWYLMLLATRLLPGIIAALILIRLGQIALAQPAFANLRSTVSLKTPVFGSMAAWTAVVRFCSVLRLSQRAGAPLSDGLNAAARATGHAPIIARAQQAGKTIAAGGSLADALPGIGLLANRTISVLATGERAGTLEEALGEVTQQAEDRRQASVNTMSAGIAGGALVMTGLVVLVALALAWTNYYQAIFERAGVEW
jgi:type II secretory pathway component PulF